MKKLTVLLLVATMSLAMVACGNSAAETDSKPTLSGEDMPVSNEAGKDDVTEAVTATEDAADTTVEEENSVAEKTDAAEETNAAEEPATTEEAPAEELPAAKETDEAEENAADDQTTYEDNFAVDAEAAAAFADKIKVAMAAQDLEALADLTNFPMYAGFADGGTGVNTREEFIELGADRIFTEEMLTSIANADGSNLSPSMAGFSLTESGRPNVIFSVVDGHLAITGMNY